MRTETATDSLEAFRERLLSVMDRKDHWAWTWFAGGTITRPQLKIHFQQEYAVYVRDFPIFLGRVHGKNPPMTVRKPRLRQRSRISRISFL